MTSLADEIFRMALSLNQIAAQSYGTPQTFETGSPEAIADCRRRQREAQQRAQAVFGRCYACNTPFENDTDPCGKCDPSVEGAPV